ncbi:hypothetical protein GTO89_03150 [Heliobacterium gestii]|uniref:Uncharacterized protein n=1 Tax=Heliomicrobium gestii TaxID=2699 RepID=A0A845L5Y5_HELGE|nr:hypothetical protein [Heliomicrobium gestii]MBM7865786.1 hypothetical protein [Heliomicrobium gestii]MZP42032.1 hypothetical protein [Heliomicrobium gestii]
MIPNLDASYSSLINTLSSTSTKKANTTLFAAQLEDFKKADTNLYINEIGTCYPGTKVTVKSMTSSDVQKYYEEWKRQPISSSGFDHNIIVSPKVLEKMKNDPGYAEKMLGKIRQAATPVGFENATLYEYKVIVRDDGEIETMACADFMNGNEQKAENNDKDKKKAAKKFDPIFFHRKIQNQRETQLLSETGFYTNLFFEPQYRFIAGIANGNRKGNAVE